jgi:NodT family efflux transporter outer membrane factor (OMF) lipoprotein
MSVKQFTNLLIFLAATLLISACSVGPDYVRPDPLPTAPMPAAFKETEGWKIAQPSDERIGKGWWRLFNDPLLNSLEEQVVFSNQNIAAAAAQFQHARALVNVNRAAYFPTVTGGASVNHSVRGGVSTVSTGTTSGTSTGTTVVATNRRGGTSEVTTFDLPFDLAWEVDVWGRIRRSVESSRASAQASQADLAAAQLSAQAELAQDYFLLRSQDAQKQILDSTVASYRKNLQLTQNRYAAGIVAKSDVLQAETQLKTTQAQAIDLEVQRTQLEHAIAMLVGKPASSFSIPVAPLAPVYPAIPAGLPSQLLERRPDIASAERRMAAANAEIGVAKAAYYPSVRLSGSAGFEALSLADWFTWPSRFWAVGAAVSETLFDGGLRGAQTDQARAVYDQAVATYRHAVLTGFQEVEDNLAALRILEAEAKAQEEALKAARETLAVTQNQYRGGIVSYLNVIVVQSAALSNERAAVSIAARRLTASVLLMKALGGGWDASALAEDPGPRQK